MARVQHRHPETADRGDDDRRLNEALERWTAASVISAAQAEAIRELEERRLARPVTKIPLVAEALGFLGGALATVAGVIAASRFWDDLSTAARLAVVGAVGLSLVAAGRVVRRGEEPALEHLGSFLWVLATGCAAFFTGIVAVDVLDWEGVDVALVSGLASTATGAALWAWRPAPLQHVATLAAVAVSVGALAGQVEHVGGRLVGISLWGLGAVWAVLAWSGRVRPVPLGYAVGGALTIVAAQVVSGDQGGALESALGVGTAIALLAASVPAGSLALLWVGVVGVFVSVPAAVTRHFGDTDAAPVALFVAGMALIATAVVASRLVPQVKARRDTRRRFSGRTVTGGLLAAITVVVTVVAALTPFEDVPTFPSLRAAPDSSIEGTVAFVGTGDNRHCITLATASGSSARQLACERDIGLSPDDLSWNAEGNLVAESWTSSGPRFVEIDPMTGRVLTRGAAPETPEEKTQGQRSSDGARLRAEETDPGRPRLVLEPTSGDPTTVFSTTGPVDYHFRDAMWSPDGRYALVEDSEDRLLIVEVDADRPSARLLATAARAPAWGAFPNP